MISPEKMTKLIEEQNSEIKDINVWYTIRDKEIITLPLKKFSHLTWNVGMRCWSVFNPQDCVDEESKNRLYSLNDIYLTKGEAIDEFNGVCPIM